MTNSFVEDFVLFSFSTKCFNALELAYIYICIDTFSTYLQTFYEQNNKEAKLNGKEK